MLPQNFAILGALVLLYGGGSYLVDTIRGRVKPNKVTWFIWACAPLIAFAAEVKQHVGLISIMTFIVGFMPLLIFIASFFNKHAQWKISRLDIICLILSLLGLLLWSITKVGNIAIAFSILSDATAAFPTILKSYHHPESESSPAYIASGIGGGITLLTIATWTFQNYAFPLYILVMDFVIAFFITTKFGKSR